MPIARTPFVTAMCIHFQFLLSRTKTLVTQINPNVPPARVMKTARSSEIENVKLDFPTAKTKTIKLVVIARPAPAIKSRSKNFTSVASLLLPLASRKRNQTPKRKMRIITCRRSFCSSNTTHTISSLISDFDLFDGYLA